ncbi:hypothetical protein EFN87_09425 [Lactococcus lactis]|nr:hypothetical protein [Lactococcus lactis subsp. lactis]MCT3099184.1 hypothetical protein [Lactococcus lactis]
MGRRLLDRSPFFVDFHHLILIYWVMDHYQIIRNKMSYIFSIFECSENGHFLNTLLFLLRLLKSFAFIVH